MTRTFSRVAVVSAAVAVVTSLVYSVTFALVVRKGYHWAEWASSAALLTGAMAAIVVVLAARERFAGREPQLAQLAVVLGLAGALGSAVHAAYDLSVLAKPVESNGLALSPTDPRGFATFALTGLALGLFGVLGHAAGALSNRTRWTALLTAASLVTVFVGRLALLDPNRLVIKVLALACGVVLNPLVLAAFGRSFLRTGALGPADVDLRPTADPTPAVAVRAS
jgi:hypothetical protein